MNDTLLIIGNGFDLHCHLKTSYSDFLSNFILKKFLPYKEELLKSHSEWKRYCSSTKSLDGPFKVPSFNHVFRVEDLFEALFWMFNLLGEDDTERLYWCDIEDRINDSIMDSLFTFSWNEVFESVPIVKKGHSAGNPYNEIGSFVETIICESVISDCGKNSLVLSDRDHFLKMVLKSLNGLEKDFGKYVDEQVSYSLEYEDLADDLAAELTDVPLGGYNVISFNYTKPVCFKSVMRNLHGDTKNPIFGIDDGIIDDDDRLWIMPFTKVSRMLSLLAKTSSMKKCEDTYHYGNHVIVYGHSLNEQDQNFFFHLFDTIDIRNIESGSQIVFAYSEIDGISVDETREDLVTSVTHLFFEYDKKKAVPFSTLENLENDKRIAFLLVR